MPTYFLKDQSDHERSASIERRVAAVVPDLKSISKIEEIVQHNRPSTELSYVLVVGPSGEEDYLEPLVAIAQQNRDRFFFILISEEISASSYKRLMRTQGADWVSAAGAPEEVLEIIAKRQAIATLGREDQHPITIAFVPAAGGVGNTTLATELGVQLKSHKALKAPRVCIVDLDFQTSHLCDHLDIEARLRINEIVEDPERLDAHLFDLFVSRHSSGVDVLATPRSKFDVSDVDVATLDGLFEMIAQRYDWILIDLPVTWYSWTQEVIANSTGVILTGINTIPGLRQISEGLTSIRSSRPGPSSVAIVINRCEHGLLGGVSRMKHVKSVLPNETIYFINDDKKAMVESVDTGVPVSLSTNRKVVKQIAAVASFCTAVRPQSTEVRVSATPRSSKGT